MYDFTNNNLLQRLCENSEMLVDEIDDTICPCCGSHDYSVDGDDAEKCVCHCNDCGFDIDYSKVGSDDIESYVDDYKDKYEHRSEEDRLDESIRKTFEKYLR